VSARNHHSHQAFCEAREKLAKLLPLTFSEYCKSRERRSLTAIKRRGNAPNATFAGSSFLQLLFGILNQAVGRVGYYCFYGTGLS
jgi:hypothetical protein